MSAGASGPAAAATAARTVVGRRYRFSAAHRLLQDAWDAAQNAAAFGHCARPHGHGYALTVRVAGTPDAATGWVAPPAALDAAVAAVLAAVDHVRLDADVPALDGAPATTERMIAWLHAELAPRVAALGAQIAGLDLQETAKNAFETEAAGAPAAPPERTPA